MSFAAKVTVHCAAAVLRCQWESGSGRLHDDIAAMNEEMCIEPTGNLVAQVDELLLVTGLNNQ
eukprot:scaffold173580_cov40-Tisochrysis_lutea.AAC.1